VANVRDWTCSKQFSDVYPFRNNADSTQYTAVYGTGAGGARQTILRTFGIPDAFNTREPKQTPYAKPPSDSWVSPLWAPANLDDKSPNLGLFKPSFFRNFGITGVQVPGKGC
jgi:hypothetical protein